MNALQNINNQMEPSNKFTLALAALVGVMGAAVSGLGLSGAGAENLPQLAAIAVPSVVAFVLSYLLYQTSETAAFAGMPLDGELTALLPELAESLQQPTLIPAAVSVSAENEAAFAFTDAA